MSPGDVVIISDKDDNISCVGIVLEKDINMWHEEVTPTGVSIMWEDGDIEIVYSDEVELLR
jgi:hypothetical protein